MSKPILIVGCAMSHKTAVLAHVAAAALSAGVDVRVVDVHTLKPDPIELDELTLKKIDAEVRQAFEKPKEPWRGRLGPKKLSL